MILIILNQFRIVKNKHSLYLINLEKMNCVFSDAKRNNLTTRLAFSLHPGFTGVGHGIKQILARH